MSSKYKVSGTTSLFSEECRLDKLSKQGGPLERLNKVIDWEYFRETIQKIHPKKWFHRGQGHTIHY